MNDEPIYDDEDEIVYDEKRREWMTKNDKRLYEIIDYWESQRE